MHDFECGVSSLRIGYYYIEILIHATNEFKSLQHSKLHIHYAIKYSLRTNDLPTPNMPCFTCCLTSVFPKCVVQHFVVHFYRPGFLFTLDVINSSNIFVVSRLLIQKMHLYSFLLVLSTLKSALDLFQCFTKFYQLPLATSNPDVVILLRVLTSICHKTPYKIF